MTTENNDRQIVERLAEMSLREQRARRRWGVFFRLLLLGYVFSLTILFFIEPPEGVSVYDQPHAAVVNISGIIAAGGDNDALQINEALKSAFENDAVKGIILRINSPGGSPVESNRIYRELQRLRALHMDKKVYAVAGDFCASGGYYIAAAADEIYVDENSLIGSIGVILSGFGFVDAMEKLGVERRVRTAGKSKNMLDPFLPADARDETHIDQILSQIHDNFVAAVRAGRGERLRGGEEIFSGAIFSGVRGIELGLADGIGDSDYVAREIIGVEEVAYYANEQDFLDSVIDRLGVKIAAMLQTAPFLY